MKLFAIHRNNLNLENLSPEKFRKFALSKSLKNARSQTIYTEE